MQIKNMSDFKQYLPEKPYVRDGKDEDQRKLFSNAISPLSETFVQLFPDISKNSIDLIYVSLTTEFKYISDSRQPKEPCLEHSGNSFYLFLLTEVKVVNYEIESSRI